MQNIARLEAIVNANNANKIKPANANAAAIS